MGFRRVSAWGSSTGDQRPAAERIAGHFTSSNRAIVCRAGWFTPAFYVLLRSSMMMRPSWPRLAPTEPALIVAFSKGSLIGRLECAGVDEPVTPLNGGLLSLVTQSVEVVPDPDADEIVSAVTARPRVSRSFQDATRCLAQRSSFLNSLIDSDA